MCKETLYPVYTHTGLLYLSSLDFRMHLKFPHSNSPPPDWSQSQLKKVSKGEECHFGHQTTTDFWPVTINDFFFFTRTSTILASDTARHEKASFSQWIFHPFMCYRSTQHLQPLVNLSAVEVDDSLPLAVLLYIYEEGTVWK